MSRWFRLDDDVINDPKVLLLPETMRWIWIAFLCIASKNAGRLPTIDIIALHLRVKVHKASEYLTLLVKANLIDQDETGFTPHNWDKRQFKSDVSTDRVKRFRKQERNVSETPPHTQAQTHTETQSSLRSDSARKRGARLSADWKPSDEDWIEANKRLGGNAGAQQELSKFHDYWKAQPGQRGVKLDWDATWRNWIRNAKGQPNGNGTGGYRTNSASGPAPTRDAAVIAGMGRALERRRAARAAADLGREIVREERCSGAAGEPDADRSAASGDDESSGQLALIPAGNTAA